MFQTILGFDDLFSFVARVSDQIIDTISSSSDTGSCYMASYILAGGHVKKAAFINNAAKWEKTTKYRNKLRIQ